MLVGVGTGLSGVGASTVADIGVWPVTQTDGFMYWVWAGVGGLFTPHPVVAQGSETLTQTLARVQDPTNGFPAHPDAYGGLPGWILVCCGRNNMNATNISDIEPLLVTYEQILDYLLSLGSVPLLVPVLPSDNAASLATHQRNLPIYNTGLFLMARKKGLALIDANHTIVNTTTGAIQTALRLDELHMNSDGAQLFGTYIANRLKDSGFTFPRDYPYPITNDANTAVAYKLANPLMLTDTNADGTPDQWTKGGADVANLTVSNPSGTSDGILGKWMRLTKTTTTGDAQVQSTSFTMTPGNWMMACWKDKYVSTSGTPVVTTYVRSSGAVNMVYKQIGADFTADKALSDNFQIFKVPAGETSGHVLITMNAVGVYDFGQVGIMDLTANGLDGWI